MANPRNRPAKTSTWMLLVMANPAPEACCWSWMMSNVWGLDLKNRARKPNSMNTLPKMVYRKNLVAAYSRFDEPHTAIRKYMGTRSRIRARKAFGRPGGGSTFHV